jgi:hypothetical protein
MSRRSRAFACSVQTAGVDGHEPDEKLQWELGPGVVLEQPDTRHAGPGGASDRARRRALVSRQRYESYERYGRSSASRARGRLGGETLADDAMQRFR